jgi:large subunit ribosomal protein L34e
VKTPGGKLTYQYKKKLVKGVKCGDCGGQIHGVAHLRPRETARVSKRQKSVSRAYGGNRCHGCVRQR